MHRYYMTAETRQAVIAESNRLIATRAAMVAARQRPGTYQAGEAIDSEWPDSQGDTETAAVGLENA